MIEHPFYNPTSTDYDVCIFQLAGTITLGDLAKVVPVIRARSVVPDGTVAIVSGWGDLRVGDDAPHVRYEEAPEFTDH